jgi:tellurite resistance protein TerC
MQFLTDNIFFILFGVMIISILLADLLLIGRHKHTVSLKESLIWTSVWVSLAIGFYFFIRFYGHLVHGISDLQALKEYAAIYLPHLELPDDFGAALDLYRRETALNYITGYLLEYTLSIDNIFVILMLLTGFSVAPENYKPVLFWGILGAIVLRFIFIFVGSALIHKFSWLLLVFGAFLIYSGIHMFVTRNKDDKMHIRDHWMVRFLSKHINIYPDFIEDRFWKRIDGKFFFTPLFVVLLMIEFTDVIFAMDSIPAIFSITTDPYIVFFSNIFAIIGLRSLFFLLARMVNLFHYLKAGISFLLAFVGFKLLFHTWLDSIGYKTTYSLYIIAGTLLVSILASVAFPRRADQEKVADDQ